MTPAKVELKRCAFWSAGITLPLYLLGLYLFNPHATHTTWLTARLGLAIIFPTVALQDSGFVYRFGFTALPVVVAAQWAWFFVPVWMIRFLAGRTNVSTARDR